MHDVPPHDCGLSQASHSVGSQECWEHSVDEINLDLNYYYVLDFIYLFLERGEGRERVTSMCGCLLCAPYWGPGLQPRHVPCLGIELATLVCEPALNPLSYTSQSSISFLIS